MSLWLFVDGTPFAESTKVLESRRVTEKYLDLVEFYKKYGHCTLILGKEEHGWTELCKDEKQIGYKLPPEGAMYAVSIYLATSDDDEEVDAYLCENSELQFPLEIKIVLYKNYEDVIYTSSVTILASLDSRIYLKTDDLEEGKITLVTFTPNSRSEEDEI